MSSKKIIKLVSVLLTIVMIVSASSVFSIAASDVVNLNSAIASKADWIGSKADPGTGGRDTANITFFKNYIRIKGSSPTKDEIVSYTKGGSFGDKLIEFNLTLESLNGNGADKGNSLFVLNTRHGFDTDYFWGAGPSKAHSYCFWVKKDLIEVQKWVFGNQIFKQQFKNNVFTTAKKAYKVRFGAIPDPNGTRIVLMVDGKSIYDKVDKDKRNVVPLENNFLSFYTFADPIKIGKVN